MFSIAQMFSIFCVLVYLHVCVGYVCVYVYFHLGWFISFCSLNTTATSFCLSVSLQTFCGQSHQLITSDKERTIHTLSSLYKNTTIYNKMLYDP